MSISEVWRQTFNIILDCKQSACSQLVAAGGGADQQQQMTSLNQVLWMSCSSTAVTSTFLSSCPLQETNSPRVQKWENICFLSFQFPHLLFRQLLNTMATLMKITHHAEEDPEIGSHSAFFREPGRVRRILPRRFGNSEISAASGARNFYILEPKTKELINFLRHFCAKKQQNFQGMPKKDDLGVVYNMPFL